MLRVPGKTVYGFDEQFDLGRYGEKRLQEFRHEKFVLTKATLTQEQEGFDFVFVNRETGEIWTLEVKTDFKASDSGNAFLETVSVEDLTRRKPGWMFSSTAQILLYFLPQLGHLYVFDLAALRAQMPDFARRFQTTFTSTRHGQDFYRTYGLLVPLTELAKFARIILQLPVKLPKRYKSKSLSPDLADSSLHKKKPQKKRLTPHSP